MTKKITPKVGLKVLGQKRKRKSKQKRTRE